MRFLIDMNLSPLWVPFIEAAGNHNLPTIEASRNRDPG